jgi:Terpene synthase family 2, C-terminal metal binding
MKIGEISVPELYCPFPPAMNPEAEAAQDHTLAWARKHALVRDEAAYERLRRSRFGFLAAHAYPKATLPRLSIASDWNTWLFVMDDECDESGIGRRPKRLGILHHRFSGLLTGDGIPRLRGRPGRIDVPLSHALCDLRDRMRALMPRAWMTRFVQSAIEYFESSEWEAENREQGVWPDAATYIRMRPYTGGLYTDIELIELTEGIDLPIVVRNHPVLKRLALLTNNVVCWSNDIFSLQKERAHRDMHNLALILHHHEGITEQAAVDQVARLIKGQVQRFIALEARLPQFGPSVDGAVRRFVAVLRAWMRGNLDWSCETGRYRHAEAPTPSSPTVRDEGAFIPPVLVASD